MANLIFTLQHEKLGLGDLSCLYLLPDGSSALLAEALRTGGDVPGCSDILAVVVECVAESLRPVDAGKLRIAPKKLLADLRANWSANYGSRWESGIGQLFPGGMSGLDVVLRNFALAEYLTMSRAATFDTLLLSMTGHWREELPPPTALPRLRSLVIREGLYNISSELLRAASELETCIIESDELVRDDCPLLSMLGNGKVRRLVLRNMDGGDSDSKVTQALQGLKTAQSLQSICFDHCDGLPLGPVVGFLVRRLERLTSLSVCSSRALPVSVVSSIGNCAHLTHVSLRGCLALNEAHLVALATGCTHIRHLNLSDSALDSRKLTKFAERLSQDCAAAVASDSDISVVLETLNLSGLKLNLAAVIAVMKSTPSLRCLLLERSIVQIRFDDEVQRKTALKVKAKNKRIGSGKKRGKGARPKEKKKKEAGADKAGGQQKKVVNDESDEKEEANAKTFDLSGLNCRVTRLLVGESIMSDWVMAQIVAHCPLLEHLDISGCPFYAKSCWPDECISNKQKIRFVATLCSAENALNLHPGKNYVVTAAIMTRDKLKSFNCFLTVENCVLEKPQYKDAPRLDVIAWPLLETLIMPHIGNFVPRSRMSQHLTTLVLCCHFSIPDIPFIETLKLVCMIGISIERDDNFAFLPFQQVPHLVLYRCLIAPTSYFDRLGFPGKQQGYGQDDEAEGPDPRSLMWLRPDWKLKRISFSRCIVRESARDIAEYDYANRRLDPNLTQKFEEIADDSRLAKW